MLSDRPRFFVSPYMTAQLILSQPLPPVKNLLYLNTKSRYRIITKEPNIPKIIINPSWRKINGS